MSHGAVGSATRLSKTCVLQRDDSVVSCVSSEDEGAITVMRGDVPISQEGDTEYEGVVRFHD